MNLLIITQKVDQNDAILGFFIKWLERLAQDFEKVVVITSLKASYQLPANVEVHSLGKESGKGKFSRRFRFYQLVKKLLPQVDTVLAHMCPEYIVALKPLNRKLKKPLFLWYTHKAVSKYLVKAEKIVEKIFTASKESCRVESDKIVVTGHGIDLDYFKPGQKEVRDYFEVISVGRIAPVKNLEVLIEAVSQLDSEVKQKVRVKLIGEPLLVQDQRYLKDIKLKTKNLKLDGIVEFIGPVPYGKILPYYQKADLFINLSKTGSIDKAVLEAMACNVPVLTSNEAFKELLPEKYLVKEGDSQMLAKKVTEFCASQHTENLRSLVEANHSLDSLINKIVNEIQKFL